MKKALTINTNTFMTVLFCFMFLILVHNMQNRAEILYKQYLKTCFFFFRFITGCKWCNYNKLFKMNNYKYFQVFKFVITSSAAEQLPLKKFSFW